MSLHNTLCARCHNEVRSSFSLVRALTDIHMPTVHRTANITTTPQTTPTLARSRQNSTTSSTASLRWRRCSAASPRLASLRHVGKQKWAMLSLPLPWTPDGLAYVDDTDSGSHEHFFPAPGFRTTKTSTHSGKARVVGSNEEDKWPLPWVPLMFCVSTYHRLFFSVLIPLYHRDLVSFISLYGLHITWNGVYYSHRFGIIDLDLNDWLSLAVQLSRGL